ncbi:MAG: heparinase II/III family protein, partial [Methylocystis sp.]
RHALPARRIVTPERLRIAPRDLRTGDATVADEIHAGYFSFCGKTVNAGEYSPFALEPPSANWRRALTGFSWLRHLRFADAALARENARALVDAFMERHGPAADDPALEPAVTARRMLSFLAHSPMLLEDAPRQFHDDFMEELARTAKALANALDGRARGTERLLCALALLEFCICADIGAQAQTEASKLFIRELERQIPSDGCHIGRNPKTNLDLALDLLPLRQLYAARGVKPPQALLAAIDRMIPMPRLLQHGDGSLALFNGMSATDPGELATVFTHEARAAAPSNAPVGGYLRLAASDALAIFDVGAPPPPEFSRHAHAGTLSFEFSLGAECVVVNCGAPSVQQETAREIARASAAHSTLVIDDQSSSRIEPLTSKSNPGLIVDGPREVRAERRRSRMGEVIEASHDGYVKRFGLVHERILALTQDGSRLIGQDRLVAAQVAKKGAAKGEGAAREFAARFHLHPGVGAEPGADGRGIALALPSGARLLFEAGGFATRLEESIFFAAPEGARKTMQIVVAGPARPGVKLRWTFARVENFDAPAPVPAPGDS